MTHLGFNHKNGVGYYLPHSQCEGEHKNQLPVMHPRPTQLVATNRYHTKTIKPYRITPIKQGFITFTVDVHLHNFTVDGSISCYSDSNINNFFEGLINEYIPTTGEITISNISSINGTFDASTIYNVCLLTLNPDVIQLKQRMGNLYQYLFQVDLEVYPNYNPVTEQLILFGTQISQLYNYFFNIDLTIDPEYQIEDYEYLNEKINYLYYYFFDLNITQNIDFNQNGNQVKLYSIKNRIIQLYIYLFKIDLSDNPYFNPNL